MKKVMLYPNPTRDLDLACTVKVAAMLREDGIQVTMPDAIAEKFGIDRAILHHIELLDFDPAIENADMIISLGGDGSILHTAKPAAVHRIPILGINIGRIGYMAELETSELAYLRQIVQGKYTTEERMMLDVAIRRGSSILYQNSGLNDVVITKTDRLKIVDLDIYTDGFYISHYQGDGVIVATPTGSTAYSMSAGGPIMDPLSRNITITPVCVHSLFAKPVVLSPKRLIAIQALSEPAGAIGVSLDGAEAFLLEYGDQIIIRESKLVTRLIRIKNKNFYDILLGKLSDRRFGDR